MRSSPARFVLVVAVGVFVLGLVVGQARPVEQSDAVTVTMLANSLSEPGFSVLIANFERVYPNITVNVTYASPGPDLDEVETSEFAASSAPDLVGVTPGCGSPLAICVLARAGYLEPLVRAPWVKRSLPLVTSLDKYGQGLFAFTSTVTFEGMFTNNALFSKLGLTVPRTFSQLLSVCEKARAAGTAAVVLGGASEVQVAYLLMDLAVATLYGQDKQWTSDLKAGKVSFDGTLGWHEALEEFVDMNNAGCFEPGATGTTTAIPLFAQGQGLMIPEETTAQGQIAAANPQFSYSFYPFPGGTASNQATTFIDLGGSLAINAHSSPQEQAAAKTFLDFIARPEQNALYAQIQGGLTQYEFLKGQLPGFASGLSSVLKGHEYAASPYSGWWNPNVLLALEQNEIGLITGQSTIDGVLAAMDAAWRQGPA